MQYGDHSHDDGIPPHGVYVHDPHYSDPVWWNRFKDRWNKTIRIASGRLQFNVHRNQTICIDPATFKSEDFGTHEVYFTASPEEE